MPIEKLQPILKCFAMRVLWPLVEVMTHFLVLCKVQSQSKLQWKVMAWTQILEAGNNKSLKSKRRDRVSNPGPLTPQTKSLTITVFLDIHNISIFGGIKW